MGGSKSSSNAAQTTSSTAGANSPLSQGKGSPINTSSGSQFVLGDNAKYDASPTVVAAAFDTIQTVIDQAISAVRDAGREISNNNEANNAGQAQLLSQVLGSAQAQSAAVSTGGQTEQNKTILYVVGAALLALAAVLIFRRN